MRRGLGAQPRLGRHLWELLPYDPERPPDVIAPGKRRTRGITVHRTRNPPPTVRYDGIPVTTPARTLTDLSSVLPFKALRRAVHEALVLGRITAAGAAAIVRGGEVPTRSHLEDAVVDLIEAAGLPTPRVNQPLKNGLVPDFRWPAHRLILEAHGAAYHDNPLAQEDDANRQARLEAQGERVIRLSYTEVLDEPEQAVERIKTALTGSPGTGPAPTVSPARGSPPTPDA